MSIRTYSRVLDWKDSETLFTHELQASPHNYFIENNLGDLYMQDGEYDKAKPYIFDSVKQYPYLGNLNNMAIIFAHDNNIKKANIYFALALNQGRSYTAYKNYAFFLLLYAKDYKKTLDIAFRGTQLYPSGSELYLAKAIAEYQIGNYKDAERDAKQADILFPSTRSHKIYNEISKKDKLHLEKDFKL